MNARTRSALAVLAAGLAAALGGAQAAAAPAEYVPFVTDFPQREEPYVPFVSDFPRPAAPAPEARAGSGGIDWSGVPAEGVAAVVAAALAAGAALGLSRRRGPAPRPCGC